MRWIGCLLMLLVSIGWLAAEIGPAGTPATAGGEPEWRRTRYGWEPNNWLTGQIPVHRPELHPGVVALLELLLSVTALLAFPAASIRQRRRTEQLATRGSPQMPQSPERPPTALRVGPGAGRHYAQTRRCNKAGHW